MPKITRIKIRDFRGIEHLDADLPPAGAVITGQNAKGKTSVLRAIGAALAANGIGPDAIRVGADRAEIVVELDDMTVRRAISQRSTQVTLEDADGERLTRPQERLRELLGTAALDPLDFFLKDQKERKRLVLEAVPIEVTMDDVMKWVGSDVPIKLGTGHGLEVLAALRKDFYDQRTEANKDAKAASARAEAARPAKPAPKEVPDLAAARALAEAAVKAAHAINGRREAAERAQAQTAGTRERITELRSRSVAKIDPGPSDDTLYEARCAETAAIEDRSKLQRQLAQAEEQIDRTAHRRRLLEEERKQAERELSERRDLGRQADELESSIAGVTGLAPTPKEVIAASDEVIAASAAHAAATEAVQLVEAHRAYAEVLSLARAAEKRAARLDDIVDTLTTRAPAELARRSEMIPGLAFHGDDMTLDGVALGSLSGAEQMRFAVDLARRLNAKAKILVVDGLERLDGVRGMEFVTLATADGWQLIATRVADGELLIEAIEG